MYLTLYCYYEFLLIIDRKRIPPYQSITMEYKRETGSQIFNSYKIAKNDGKG